MIFVERNRVPEPQVLSKAFNDGKTETERAIEYYTNWNGQKQYKFTRYSEQEVKDNLEQLFLGKCAYCESLFGHISPEDIEHWRPKGSVILKNGTEKKPAYYWLAATWSNLLPSCIDCNRRRRQEDVRNPANEQSGKKNLFPVADENHRWTGPEQTDQNGEEALLLHPCVDKPTNFFTVDEDGVFRELQPDGTQENKRARESIDVFGLNRSKLVDERKIERALVVALCRDIEFLLGLLPHLPTGNKKNETKNEIKIKLSDLKAHQKQESPYLFMKLPLISGFVTRVQQNLADEGIVPN